jgi:hypothetical protein
MEEQQETGIREERILVYENHIFRVMTSERTENDFFYARLYMIQEKMFFFSEVHVSRLGNRNQVTARTAATRCHLFLSLSLSL